jgi:hypothetical protein
LQLPVRNPFFVESHGDCGLAKIGHHERLLARYKRAIGRGGGGGEEDDLAISARIVEGRKAVTGEVTHNTQKC